ncbi:hypothetical protein [Tsukamurella tyrosinosolvens]|uniref:hypothetical protein n=1 Tax=Tsukamurella tyrosinosolvens TaxID=57704 RepID=UPI000C7E95E9|nr:hypothetical protein [Tsukamurella tyrosinosolvens]AUN42573.1 hypothetical protein ASU32_23205 [Tsukamurella tyrosinosolvens]
MFTFTSTFTACGVTVTPDGVSRTITMCDPHGCTITVPTAYAADLDHDICEAMREGVTDGVLEDGPHAVAYDGSLGGADPRWVRDGLPVEFSAVTTLYTGIFAAVAEIKAEPIQRALHERLGVSGQVRSDVGRYGLYVSADDAAPIRGVDGTALRQLGLLGLLGDIGLDDGSILATELLRVAPSPIVVAGLDLGIAATETNGLILTAGGRAVELSFGEASDLYQKLVQAEDTPAQCENVLLGGGLALSGATGSGKSCFIGQLRSMLGQLASLDTLGAHNGMDHRQQESRPAPHGRIGRLPDSRRERLTCQSRLTARTLRPQVPR